jgi:tripartite-type tricarboxylate transporter receptor subunit TctC
MTEQFSPRPTRRVSRRAALGLIGAGALVRSGWPAFAQEAEPIKIVIAFPPGGTSTASLQPLRAPLGASLGAPIEFEYRPGLGGNVATLRVIEAKPDGRTLLFGHAGPLAINHHILVQTVFDPQGDLRPLAMVVQYPIVICAAARLNVSTLKELIDLARREQLVAGSSGNGSIQHLALETFSRATGAKVLHIPFAGGGPLQEAFERGALTVLLETGSNIVKHVQAGTLRPLAVMARERLSTLPDVPTFVEATGTAGLEVSAWFGLLAPARTPDDISARITEATLAALERPDVRAALTAIGGLVTPMDAGVFKRFIADENERWGRVIAEAGLVPIGTSPVGRIGTPH